MVDYLDNAIKFFHTYLPTYLSIYRQIRVNHEQENKSKPKTKNQNSKKKKEQRRLIKRSQSRADTSFVS